MLVGSFTFVGRMVNFCCSDEQLLLVGWTFFVGRMNNIKDDIWLKLTLELRSPTFFQCWQSCHFGDFIPTRQTKWHQINIKLTSFLECLTSVWHNKKTSNWRQNEPLLTSIWCHFVMSKWRQISLNYVNLMFVWCQFDVCLMSFRRRN